MIATQIAELGCGIGFRLAIEFELDIQLGALMNWKLIHANIWVVLLLASSQARADPINGVDVSSIRALASECRILVRAEDDGYTKPLSSVDMFSAGMCTGYLQGLRNGLDLFKATKYNSPICIPQTVTVDQLARVFVKWADEHPETLHQNMAVGVTFAWAQAFPCPVK